MCPSVWRSRPAETGTRRTPEGGLLWVLEYTVVFENSPDLVQANPGLCGKIRPGGKAKSTLSELGKTGSHGV